MGEEYSEREKQLIELYRRLDYAGKCHAEEWLEHFGRLSAFRAENSIKITARKLERKEMKG